MTETTEKSKQKSSNYKKLSDSSIVAPTYLEDSTEAALERYRKIRDKDRRERILKELKELSEIG